MGDEKLLFIKRKSQDMFSKPCRWITDRWLSDASWSWCLNNEISSGDKRFHKSHSLHSRFELFDHSPGFYYRNVSMEFLFSLFKLLRVVDIDCGFSFGYEVLNVPAILVHLRYFSLTYEQRYCDAPLCVKLFEHWNMQSFIVRGNFVTLDFSEASGIWMMPLLRDFCVEKILSLETLSVVYNNLENISWLDPKLCTKDLFTRIPNLKKLGIDGGYAQSPDCFYNFVHLEQLETLSIRRWRYLKRIPCSGIPWGTSFLPNLKKLKFFRTRLLPWSDMRLIGMLPNLEVLKLINACQGPTWEPYNGGFCRLKRLVIEDTLLKYWNAGSDHFPVLECLELCKCKYLEEIPSGFVDITTLALIQLNYCLDSLLTSAKWIQDERLNIYGNSILIRSENIRCDGEDYCL
nr:putative late blight resistance protein homolog R1A-10 [Ipomoea trifida]